MFFPERIKSIKPTDRVLEIGPGGNPYKRADVFLERRFDEERTACAQRGYAPGRADQNKVVYYDGGAFPFKDKEFDYIICSHVIEHVPAHELEHFMSELQRVAPKGYIEFPNIFYELINFQGVHLWLMNYRDGVTYFMDKRQLKSNYVHKVYREMFYMPDQYLFKAFLRYRELFFCGFEWEGDLRYEFVDSYDELINKDDYEMLSLRLKGYEPDRDNGTIGPRKRYYLSYACKAALRLLRGRKNYFVHKTAVLEKEELVIIGDHAEVKDYVIIRTHSNQVKIGAYTQINPFTVIYGGSGVIIGDNVMVAPHCMIAAGDHDFKQTAVPIRFAGSISKGPIVIEDNVWIGANCTITDGVRIGRDAVVGANSVVTRDVEPYDIVAGTPARVIGNRKNSGAVE